MNLRGTRIALVTAGLSGYYCAHSEVWPLISFEGRCPVNKYLCPEGGSRLPPPEGIRIVLDPVPEALKHVSAGELAELAGSNGCKRPSGVRPAILVVCSEP